MPRQPTPSMACTDHRRYFTCLKQTRSNRRLRATAIQPIVPVLHQRSPRRPRGYRPLHSPANPKCSLNSKRHRSTTDIRSRQCQRLNRWHSHTNPTNLPASPTNPINRQHNPPRGSKRRQGHNTSRSTNDNISHNISHNINQGSRFNRIRISIQRLPRSRRYKSPPRISRRHNRHCPRQPWRPLPRRRRRWCSR